MQARIAAARRDAETLKDKIKRKKDELADTNREFLFRPPQAMIWRLGMIIASILDPSQIWLN